MISQVQSLPILLIKHFLPYPKYCHRTNHAKHEIREVAFAEQLYIQQMGNECTSIAADYAHDEVHATALALTAHDAVGYVTDEYACQYGPGCKFCDVS